MAMNEMDTTRRYTKYKRHVNDSTERIDAQDVNQIQENINEHQEDTNIIKDTAFQERVYTIFENNLYTNAMFLDVYENGQYINKVDSSNYVLDSKLNNIYLDKNHHSYLSLDSSDNSFQPLINLSGFVSKHSISKGTDLP